MKRLFITLAALALAHSAAHAQLHSRSSSYVGLKLGGSAASYGGDMAQYDRTVYGGHAGVFASLALSRPFTLQPEILYSMKGTMGQAAVSDATERLGYLDIPVALRANLNSLFVEAGPQVGFLLSAKYTNGGESVSVRKARRDVDFGYLLGVGYQPVKGGLGIGGRYNAGFLSVYTNPLDGSDAADVHNSVFQLYVTYSANKYHKSKRPKGVK